MAQQQRDGNGDGRRNGNDGNSNGRRNGNSNSNGSNGWRNSDGDGRRDGNATATTVTVMEGALVTMTGTVAMVGTMAT